MWSKDGGYDNGGIPADWTPNITPTKSEPLEKIKALIYACEPIANAARKVPPDVKEEGKPITIHSWSITMSSVAWLDLVKAYDEVKFK